MAKDNNNNKKDKDEIIEGSDRKGDKSRADKKDERGQLKEESIQEHPEH